jgi:hypothetical protein
MISPQDGIKAADAYADPLVNDADVHVEKELAR